MPLDDSFELRILVAGTDEEEPRILAHAAIGLGVDGNLLRTPGVGALTEVRRLGRGAPMAFFEARDVLVHLAKERFVAGGPLLPERRHTTVFNVNRYRTQGKAVYGLGTMAMRAYNKPFDRGGDRAMDARKANDRIAEKAEQLRFVSRVPMICECSDPACRTIVMITLGDYYAVRQSADALLTAPGHRAGGAALETRTPDYDVRRVGRSDDGDRRSA